MNHKLKQINFMSIDWFQSVALRYELLRKPLGLEFTPQELFGEKQEIVFGVFKGDLLVSTANCILSEKCVKIRQVATRYDFQRLGVGMFLINGIEAYFFNNGIVRIEMNARKSSLDFYKKIGYLTTGNEFFEVGIPHLKIYKTFLSE